MEELAEVLPVEELAEAIQHELESVIEECIPSKLSSTRCNQPWFNSTTKRATRRKARAYRKARRTNKERDWLRFRRLKKESQKQCRNSYNKYIYDIVHSNPGERNKKLGALIKSKRTDQMGVAPLKDNGLLHADPKTKANILNWQFTSVFSVDDGSPVPDLGNSQHPSMDNITVDQNGVIKLAPAVTLLFQASINQGKIPSQWKKAQITPIFKKGSRSEAANYRPISLPSCASSVSTSSIVLSSAISTTARSCLMRSMGFANKDHAKLN